MAAILDVSVNSLDEYRTKRLMFVEAIEENRCSERSPRQRSIRQGELGVQMARLKLNYFAWKRESLLGDGASEAEHCLIIAFPVMLRWAKDYLNWHLSEEDQDVLDQVRDCLLAEGLIE